MAKSKTSGIYFRVSDEEWGLIEQRMALMGVHNMSACIWKMCMGGGLKGPAHLHRSLRGLGGVSHQQAITGYIPVYCVPLPSLCANRPMCETYNSVN